MQTCRICLKTNNNEIFSCKEMFFGYRDTFIYFKCGNCGCLQIEEMPENISKYYPENYYSYHKSNSSFIKNFFNRYRVRSSISQKTVFGKALTKLFGYPFDPEWFDMNLLNYDSKILDIGCGAGDLLNKIQLAGFRNLTGVDPYIKMDTTYDNGVKILKREISEINDSFDLVMMHSSLEHIFDQTGTLLSINKLLSKDGYLLLRIPILSPNIWEMYNTAWVQLDAPRHFYLHSLKSITLLAEKSGFNIKKYKYDSSEFLFWGSEQYKNNIPLVDEKSYGISPQKSMFSKKDILNFKKRASHLNTIQQGDNIALYLTKKPIKRK